MNDPTVTQVELSRIATTEILELMARQNAEGMDWRIVLTGAASAISQVVAQNVGPGSVAGYFAGLAHNAHAAMNQQ